MTSPKPQGAVMRRRDFVRVVVGLAAGLPFAARAQQPDRMRLYFRARLRTIRSTRHASRAGRHSDHWRCSAVDAPSYPHGTNRPIPVMEAGSRRTATRLTSGAISLSSSSHFALKSYSNSTKPVALPPGRDRLSMKPEPTGSEANANTASVAEVEWAHVHAERPRNGLNDGELAGNKRETENNRRKI
jgi:hypothetical protein